MHSSSSELMPVGAAEALCLTQPQVGCQVVHRFGPGVYIRECIIPAGVFAVGHHHRRSHTNIVLAGEVSMRENDGPIHVVRAPHFYVSEPGRKMGLVLKDLVWQNIYATTETDVERLESQLFDKSPAFLDLAGQVRAAQSAQLEADRADFLAVLDEHDFTPYQARAISENESDQIPMPGGYSTVIRRSAIEGLGVFTQVPAQLGDVLAPARIGRMRTPAGRYANHSRNPNAAFVERDGNVYLEATRPIAPYCNELVPGDEVTVDYRQALRLAWRLG